MGGGGSEEEKIEEALRRSSFFCEFSLITGETLSFLLPSLYKIGIDIKFVKSILGMKK